MLVLVSGTVLGLGATALVLDRKIDPAAVTIGPWAAWAKVGTPAIDPYAQAINATTGVIPMAAAQGVTFMASSDDTGASLSARCLYRLAGSRLAARFWTLTATMPNGAPMDNAALRRGFSSTDILRREDGGFVIVAAPSAHPGNWLPLAGHGGFVLTLRLYDSPLGLVFGDLGKATLPSLTPLGCVP